MQLSIQELTEKYNLTIKTICHCDGFETFIFRDKNGLEVRWRKYQQVYQIRKNRKIVKAWDKITNFQTEFIKHVAV